MNNRFKFRVWDIEKKKYMNSNAPTQEYRAVVDTDGDVCFVNIEDFFYYPPDECFIIEQCTGLKDKNGNLIYEGDLLNGMPVVWVNDLNGFRVKVNTICGWNWHYINEFTNQEITGNIHEQKDS